MWGEKSGTCCFSFYLVWIIVHTVAWITPAGAIVFVSSPPAKKPLWRSGQVSVTRSWHFHLLCDMRLCGCDTRLMYWEWLQLGSNCSQGDFKRNHSSPRQNFPWIISNKKKGYVAFRSVSPLNSTYTCMCLARLEWSGLFHIPSFPFEMKPEMPRVLPATNKVKEEV